MSEEEKYSRQIKLFGASTQRKIETTRVFMRAPESSSRFVSYFRRLLLQVGGQFLTYPLYEAGEISGEVSENDWLVLVDTPPHPSELHKVFAATMYICTDCLSFAIGHPSSVVPSHPRRPGNVPKTSGLFPEYLNILAALSVQEYIKFLSGMQALTSWFLDVSIFDTENVEQGV